MAKVTKPRKKLTSSLEDYLEAVYALVRRDNVARVRDIAEHWGVGMPSVTAAMKNLSKRGLVNYDPYQVVTLTEAGQGAAEKVSRAHDFLRRFLANVLGLDADVAEANACRLEHAVDAELLARLRGFAEFIDRCPRAGEDWVQEFLAFCNDGQDARRCKRCVNKAAKAFQAGK